MSPLSPETLHQHLTLLLRDKPQLWGHGNYEDKQHAWLGRALALVKQAGGLQEIASMRAAVDGTGNSITRERALNSVMVVLNQLLSEIELKLPAAARGAFIDIGAQFSAFQAVSSVFTDAKTDVFAVDPYLSEKALFDFLPSAPEGINLRLLCDGQASNLHSALRTGFHKWVGQYGGVRPLEVRVTAPRTLHDRLIIVDKSSAWTLTQSFKDLAQRSPASLLRADPDVAEAKIHAYETIWAFSPQL